MYVLEKVFTGKNKIKLLRFLIKNPDWQFNLTSISEKIKVDKGSVSRVVKELEKEKLIEVRRSGNLLLFKLDFNNKIVKLVKKLFEVEGGFR